MSTTTNAAKYRLTMSEAELQDGVAQAAQAYGYRVVHFRAGRRKTGTFTTPVQYDAAGWPDLLCVHPEAGVVVAIECKSHRGRLSPAQRQWLVDLNATGIETWTCNPASYHTTIDHLETLAKPAAQLKFNPVSTGE